MSRFEVYSQLPVVSLCLSHATTFRLFPQSRETPRHRKSRKGVFLLQRDFRKALQAWVLRFFQTSRRQLTVWASEGWLAASSMRWTPQIVAAIQNLVARATWLWDLCTAAVGCGFWDRKLSHGSWPGQETVFFRTYRPAQGPTRLPVRGVPVIMRPGEWSWCHLPVHIVEVKNAWSCIPASLYVCRMLCLVKQRDSWGVFFYKKRLSQKNSKIEIVTLTLRIDGSSVLRINHFFKCHLIPHLCMLENMTVLQNQVQSNWFVTKIQNSGLLT
jgi:hypothetical protein